MNGRKLMRWTFGLVLVTSLFAGCSGTAVAPTPGSSTVLTLTPVPSATWIAQGVPEDTVIECALTQSYKGRNSSVTIYADGTVNSAITDANQPDSFAARGTGQISQDELKRIVLKFAELDFFSLNVRNGCVYNVNHPPDPSIRNCWEIDGSSMTISITIRGMSKSIEYGTDPPWDRNLDTALRQLTGMILTLDRFAGEPQWVTPTTSVDENSIVKVIQGEWTATQAYDVAGERVWITGTLTIEGNSYTFKPVREVEGPSVQGDLDFLFDMPRGEVTIRLPSGVTPNDVFGSFSPGDTLATCMFRANSAVIGEFQIRVRDSNSLDFHSPSGDASLWSVTKQLGVDSEQ